jgi:hypothetical protein
MLDYSDAIVASYTLPVVLLPPFPTGLFQQAQNTRNQCRSSPTQVPTEWPDDWNSGLEGPQ